jgi:hypothetical protein
VLTHRRFLALLLSGSIALALIPYTRAATLRTAGWALVAEDPLAPADAIVVTVDAEHAGILEAADLVRAGLSGHVALLAEPQTPAEQEFAKRDLPYEDAPQRAARHLTLLGVSSIERIPGAAEGTESEARLLREWCARRAMRSIIVIGQADHTRRLRRVLQRSLAGHAVTVRVRGTRYSEFDPDRWWTSRGGVRTQIIETQKLLLDFVRHPLS